MADLAKRGAPWLLVVCLSAWMASLPTDFGDWDSDAAAAVHALASGEVGRYLAAAPMMGPFATFVEAPFVALSGSSGLDAYHWASFPCILAAGIAGLLLAKIAVRRGVHPTAAFLLPLVCVINPLTFEALAKGHPEEILTAALCIASVASAAAGSRRRTALLLGLAIASKQWAVIAVLPALLALPGPRLRIALGAGAVAAALMLPGLLAAPDSFLGVQQQAAATGHVITPWSAWYPLASGHRVVYEVDGERLEDEVEEAPALAGSLSHPLILLLAVALPLLVARRRGLPLSPSCGFALLALLALLRCVLDPVDNLYYHLPLLLAVAGWDACACRSLPLRSLLGVAVAYLFWKARHEPSDPVLFNGLYLATAAILGGWLASTLFAPISWTGVPLSAVFAGRDPNFRD